MIIETDSTKNNITFYVHLYVLNYGEVHVYDILINESWQCQTHLHRVSHLCKSSCGYVH